MRPVLPTVLRLVLPAFLVVSSSAILYATVMNEFSLGMRWTPRVFTEAGYEFSHGDSFLSSTVLAPPTVGGGRGRAWGRYSSTFNAVVFKEKVDSHAFSFSAGIDWTRSWFSTVNYTYRT